jgi:hypothetical protein
MRHPSRRFLLALTLGLAIGASGCGSKSEPGPTQAKLAAPVKKVGTPADSLSPYLVAAVTTAKSGATMLQVKFELGARPEVGDPVDVDLVIVPAADNIDGISGTIQGDDGLEVVSGATMPQAEKPVFGTPIHHSLKLRAKRDGIFTLNASMTVESGGQALGPVYSMPIIAGNGLADSGAAAAPRPSQPKPAPTAAAK